MALRYRRDPPEDHGWVRVVGRVWRRPDGSLYEFPRGVPEVIIVLDARR